MAFRRYSTKFVGRENELARLNAVLHAATEGRPGAVLIGGEAGVGKTRLVSRFADRAHGAGMRVLAGGCIDVSGSGLPYGPIVEAFRGLEHDLGPPAVRELLGADHVELGRFLPVGGEEAPSPGTGGRLARGRLFELFLRLLDRLGQAAPVVLVVEDLHWADRSTLDLLAFLVRNIVDERLVLVATYRGDEQPSAALRDFRAEVGRVAARIELSRFGRDDMVALLTGALGAAPPVEVVDRILASSDGNPFFAEELLAAGLDRKVMLTPRLRDVLMARVEALSDDGQETLRAAAVIGRRVDHLLLASVSELGRRRLLRALREAVSQQILIADPEGLYVFRHALAREAVYGDLIAGERLGLHAAVARALATDPSWAAKGASAAAELAHHWYEARELPRALAATVASARSATSVYAFAEADRQYARALGLWEPVAPKDRPAGLDLAELLQEAAEAARWAGDAERAASLIRRALTLVEGTGDPGTAGLLHERLGLYLWEAGDGKRSLDAYEEANRLLTAEPSSGVRARVLAAYGAALMLSSRYREARTRCQAAIAMAQAAGARRPEMHAQNTLGFSVALLGEPDDGIARLERSREMAEEDGDFEGVCRAFTNLATVLLVVGRLEVADRVAEQGIAMTRRLGIELTGGAVLLGILASVRFRLGRWDDAETLVREVLARPVPHGLALIAHVTQVELHTGRGRLDLARASLDEALASARGVTDPITLGDLYAMWAELAIWSGDHQAARAAVASGLRTLSASDEVHLELRLCALGIRCEADQVERLPTRRAVAELTEIGAAASSLLTRAQAAARRGRPGRRCRPGAAFPLLPDLHQRPVRVPHARLVRLAGLSRRRRVRPARRPTRRTPEKLPASHAVRRHHGNRAPTPAGGPDRGRILLRPADQCAQRTGGPARQTRHGHPITGTWVTRGCQLSEIVPEKAAQDGPGSYVSRLPLGLQRALAEGRWLPLIGAGLSANATTADGRRPPAWAGLGEQFGEELDVDAANPIDVLSTFQSTYDRPYLVNRLSDLLLVDEVELGSVHQSLAQLPFDMVVTTNVDFLLERAYQEQRRPCIPLIGASQLTINRRPEATYLLKFHGDLNHPDDLVVTEDDYDGYLQRQPVLTTFVSSLFLNREPVLLGYSLDDPDMREILTLLRERLGRMTRAVWAILPTDPHKEEPKFVRRGLKPIVLNPDTAADRSTVLAQFFEGLRTLWEQEVASRLSAGSDASTAELRRRSGIAPQLGLFVASRAVLSLYRDFVFPAVPQSGLIPLGVDDIQAPDPRTAPMAIDTALSKAAVVVYDTGRGSELPLTTWRPAGRASQSWW